MSNTYLLSIVISTFIIDCYKQKLLIDVILDDHAIEFEKESLKINLTYNIILFRALARIKINPCARAYMTSVIQLAALKI